MKNFTSVVGVRCYPTGGVICQKVRWKDCLSPSFAAVQFAQNKQPVLIRLHDLFVFRVAVEMLTELERVAQNDH